ncbi:AAA family ATPase [Aquimarina sp. MMG016]|uniref:AAA family ATPase n=1 Tax=Aquimarina sp. MMG016 TaxID=2822690 RepID=UPI001B3A073A|nr:AAA family ATPase [Aquimarina sp. MMG016]MBQ4818620.1 AAA family ATPase [Aquimarina sp. MMG016]
MIESIEKIENLGCFSKYEKPEQLKSFDVVNTFYGANGTGKSTLSNLLYCLSKHCPNKNELIEEYFETNTEIEIITSEGKITKNNISKINKDIYVFNTNFITEHIFNGTDANISSFDATIKLTNKKIDVIDAHLRVLKARLDYIQEVSSKLNTKFDNTWGIYKKEFQERVVGPRLTNVKPDITANSNENLATAKLELEQLYQSYKKKDEESNSLDKISQIEIQLQGINNDPEIVDVIKSILKTNVKEVTGERIKNNIELATREIEKRNLQDEVLTPSNWFRNAGRYLYLFKENSKEKCPLCDSDISDRISDIIDEYSEYFNDNATKLLDSIQNSENHLQQLSYKKTEQVFGLIIADLKDLSITYNYSKALITKEKVDIDKKKLSSLLSDKRKSLSEKVDHEELVGSDLNQYLSQIDDRIREIKKLIDSERNKLESVKLADILSKLKSKVATITTLDFNQDLNKVLKPSKKLNFQLATQANRVDDKIKNETDLLTAQRASEVSKLDAESKFVNIYLSYLGIDHFSIQRNKAANDNLIINYKSGGKPKKGLKATLSEGEKTSLAFSYFISKIRAEVLEGEEDGFKGKTIVIDDPISSLDENRLFQTANLIDSFFFYSFPEVEKYPEQVFFFSHNYSFAKYLNNNLKTNERIRDKCRDFYIKKERPKIDSLPSSLTNYTNTYIIKLQEIMNFKSKGIPEYNVAKNYLPNYIRIVMETFLSFKLATIKDDFNYLPTFTHLIRKMVSQLGEIDDYEITVGGNKFNKQMAIERLNHLKRISDHESHGSISSLQEMKYISEAELKNFAKYTLQVINYLDDIHLNKIKGMT